MFRRSAKDFLKDNLFSVIVFFFATVAALGLYWTTSRLSKKIIPVKVLPNPKKSASAKEEKFVVTCFDEKVGIRCKSEKGKYCSAGFQKTVENVCAGMEALDISSLDKIVVGIREYDKCNEKMEKRAGCMPHFFREGDINGYGAGFIYLPASLFGNKESLKDVLIHEITHALTSKYQATMARIVKEFFAIYAQIQFSGNNLYLTCNGAEWNQPALRNYSGEYAFPPEKNNKPMKALSKCRYGQLEYVVRQLNKQSPFLFNALWRELEKNKNDKIDTAWLKRKIIAIDKAAGEIVSKFHILNEADANPQLVIIGDTYEHCAFVYKNAGASEEYYDEKAGFQMEWRRNNKHAAWNALSHAPLLCYAADKFLPGDVLHIRATGFGKSFYRIFIVPSSVN